MVVVTPTSRQPISNKYQMDKYPNLGVIFSLMSVCADFIGLMACLQKQWAVSISQIDIQSYKNRLEDQVVRYFIQLINKKSMASQFSYFEHDIPSKSLFEAIYSPEVSAALFNVELESYDNLGELQISPNNHSLSIKQQKKACDTIAVKKKQEEKTGCSCKKISCFKMYCQCLAFGKACGQACKCFSCKNNDQNSIEKQKIDKKKLEKQAKKQMRKCNCRKSQCQRKYCDCFRSNEGCSQLCKCIDCKNSVDFDSPKNQIINKGDNNSEKNNPPFGKIQPFNSEDDIDRFYA